MKFTVGVFAGAIDSMLLWDCFACGWNLVFGALGIALGMVLFFAVGIEMAENWD